jgi:hypothetical protein
MTIESIPWTDIFLLSVLEMKMWLWDVWDTKFVKLCLEELMVASGTVELQCEKCFCAFETSLHLGSSYYSSLWALTWNEELSNLFLDSSIWILMFSRCVCKSEPHSKNIICNFITHWALAYRNSPLKAGEYIFLNPMLCFRWHIKSRNRPRFPFPLSPSPQFNTDIIHEALSSFSNVERMHK